jgi:hypothetical protein
MFVKKVFNWLSHCLQICIPPVPNNMFLFEDEYPKYEEFYTDFKSVERIGKKCVGKIYLPKTFKLVV